MTNPLDLDALEEHAFRSRFDTGLLDVVLGLFVLLFGLSIGTGLGGLAGVWAVVAMSLWYPAHKLIVEPRLGYAEFGPGRRAQVRRKHLLMTVALGLSALSGVAAFLLFESDSEALRQTMRALGPIPFGVMLALMVAVGGALLGIRRGYAYAAVIAGLVAGGHLAGLDLRPMMIVAGGIVAGCGAMILARFLRRFPRPVEDGPHDGR